MVSLSTGRSCSRGEPCLTNALPLRFVFRLPIVAVTYLLSVGSFGLADEASIDQVAIEKSVRRAVDYLSPEVANWKTANKCYSCHNHGDGARALFAAKRRGLSPSTASIQVATEWLKTPAEWDHNGPDGPFSDRKLARIQFAAALSEGFEAGIVTDRKPLVLAAEHLVRDQLPDGPWDFEGADATAAPTTYGRVLATVLARHVLHVADPQRFTIPISRSDEWLRTLKPRSVIDAAAVLWGLRGAKDEAALEQRQRCRELFRSGQGEDGGWGPFVMAGSEPFDTALVLLALAPELDDAARGSRVRGVNYLIRQQLSDGSWPETTRPVPRESYSQRISTTAWCTLALLDFVGR